VVRKENEKSTYPTSIITELHGTRYRVPLGAADRIFNGISQPFPANEKRDPWFTLPELCTGNLLLENSASSTRNEIRDSPQGSCRAGSCVTFLNKTSVIKRDSWNEVHGPWRQRLPGAGVILFQSPRNEKRGSGCEIQDSRLKVLRLSAHGSFAG